MKMRDECSCVDIIHTLILMQVDDEGKANIAGLSCLDIYIIYIKLCVVAKSQIIYLVLYTVRRTRECVYA